MPTNRKLLQGFQNAKSLPCWVLPLFFPFFPVFSFIISHPHLQGWTVVLQPDLHHMTACCLQPSSDENKPLLWDTCSIIHCHLLLTTNTDMQALIWFSTLTMRFDSFISRKNTNYILYNKKGFHEYELQFRILLVALIIHEKKRISRKTWPKCIKKSKYLYVLPNIL